MRLKEEKSHPIVSESWDDVDLQPSTEWDDHKVTNTNHSGLKPTDVVTSYNQMGGGGGTVSPPHTIDHTMSSGDGMWDSEVESKGSQTVFPEAFADPASVTVSSSGSLPPLPGLPRASSAQPTSLASTAPTLPQQSTPGSLLQQQQQQNTPVPLPQRPISTSTRYERTMYVQYVYALKCIPIKF